ncbi:efflux RND transporter permease subunit [Saccharicrinis aurantiacus]|uniref:efflux RND transporter permease subunit n=1 Tax=Saccharicrinis aurantiacus TaxID=1849719 RepID=UPI0024901A3E|nr:efflux RND transporter permease subunit [Saccharicrinis aurantiacus]
MSLSEVSIKRPVLASVFSIAIILFGVVGYLSLGVREYPSTDSPVVTVRTNYNGANAQVVESQITEPIEEAVNGISGVKNLISFTKEGMSYVKIEFDIDVDLETATNDVRDKVSGAVRLLPSDCDPPTVAKADDEAVAILSLSISSSERSLLDLSHYANNVIKEKLQTIKDVSEVQNVGEQLYAMRIRIDPYKLIGHKLTPKDIRDAIKRENVELPSGAIEGEAIEITIKTLGRLNTPEDFKRLILKESGNKFIRLEDVAHVDYGAKNERTILRRNGIPATGLDIIPLPNSNSIEVADEFYLRLSELRNNLPDDIKLDIDFDATTYIRKSILEVKNSIFIAFLLVAAIIFLFLRDWRSSIIPLITIPISLIGTFFVMYLFGFSINVLSLLAIVLAIGLVVDDAIVVLENIYGKIEEGIAPMQAGLRGSKEIYFAVIATTIALVAVFLPIIFLDGMAGRLFREFSIVLTSAVIISSFVALSIAPMLSTKLLRKRETPTKFYSWTEPFFIALTNAYAKSLTTFMKAKWLAIPIIIICTVLIGKLYNLIPEELAPLEDRSELRVNSTGAEGTTFESTDRYALDLWNMIQEQIPEEDRDAVTMTTAPGSGSTGTNQVRTTIRFADITKRDVSQAEYATKIKKGLSNVIGSKTSVVQPPTIGSMRGGADIMYILLAPTLDDLMEKAPDFIEEARLQPEFSYVDTDLSFSKPELLLTIDRDKAKTIGVSVMDISETLQLGLSGQRYDYFLMEGRQYEVIGQLEREKRSSPNDLQAVNVRSQTTGRLISLDNFINLEESSDIPKRFRDDRFISAVVKANLNDGYMLGDGIDALDRVKDKVLNDRFSSKLRGNAQELKESSNSLLFAFLFAIALIYLVLAAQFESFKDPFIILLTVPLAIFGALTSMWLFNESLNIFSQIGAIMLIGLVTKNGILIVEFANQKKQSGMHRNQAIMEAASSRFRPILMTALSTIFGTLPLAMATGEGAASRQAMGIAVIGGMFFASLLTLYIVPSIYTYLSSKTALVEELESDKN